MMNVGLLKHNEILKVRAAVISAGLAESRTALLAGIDPAFVASLPHGSAPGQQVLTDLDAMNVAGSLGDDTRPLFTWLSNAIALAEPRKEARVFRQAREQLGEAGDVQAPQNTPLATIDVFFSYSHKDEMLRDELATHLKVLARTGVIRSWHDRQIGAGENWKGEIDDHLEKARIVLLLVSAHFLASDYCYDVEMKRALARRDAGEATVLPVILRKCNWARAPFAKLQALPKDAKPVTSWTSRDAAWTNVAEGIESVAVRIAAGTSHI